MIPVPKEQQSSVPSPIQPNEAKNAPVSVVIADDHVLFNDGVKQLLSTTPGIMVLQQVFDGKEVEACIHKDRPDVLLLDINLPGIDGLELSKRLKKSFPSLKIILLSMYSDKQFIQRAEELKLEGYLLKSATKSELVDGIEAVCSGSRCFSVKENMAGLHSQDDFVKKYKLTRREQEIIRLVKEGKSSQEIAETIHLSIYTVETHRRNINLKLGVKNVAELIKMATELGI